MPTQLQENVFKDTMKAAREGRKASISQLALKNGASPSYAKNPQRITRSRGWEKLLAKVDDNKILEKFYKIALDVTDKRACLEAGKEIFKLKDRYPARKFKVTAFDEREGVVGDESAE